ncbi:MAG: MarC family protein [Flavobacteriales bacterium]|nr:MarC family protein [Flavobacteriales bacterium]
MTGFFAKFDWAELGVTTMVLFAVIDIVGSIPVIIKIKKDAGDINSLRATVIAFAIMIAFLLGGESILNFMGVDKSAFAVAGSFILFALALEMSLGIQINKQKQEVSPKLATIVPIAFPLIAGAGTMTTLVSLRAEYEMINIILAVVVNMVIVYLVLRLTKNIEKLLGSGGIAVLEKVFGIILLAIAIKLFTENVKVLFN